MENVIQKNTKDAQMGLKIAGWISLLAITLFEIVFITFDFGVFSFPVIFSFGIVQSVIAMKTFMNFSFNSQIFKAFVFIAVLTLVVVLVIAFAGSGFTR